VTPTGALQAYAADVADALERVRVAKQAAEEAKSEAASLGVLTIARMPTFDPLAGKQKEREEALASVPAKDQAVVKGMLAVVEQEDKAAAEAAERETARAAKDTGARLSEQAMEDAEAAAKQGPHAMQLLAMRQMWADLSRVRRLSGGSSSEEESHKTPSERGQEMVVGPVQGALADAMGLV
jgi:protein involved in temperature-dependent protein secretion